MADDELRDAVERLTQEVERLNTHRFVTLHNSPWKLWGFQLVRGMAFGLGTVIGATLLVSLFAWWVAQVEFIPVIGEWLQQIVQEMETRR